MHFVVVKEKTVNGQTTTFKYDGANQLVSKEDVSGTTTYAYDAAGRMVREGGREYRYSYLDKITSVVENGETAATMDYFVGGEIASVMRGGDAERFIWDGLALVHRDGSDYLNEPFVGELGYVFLMRSYRPENGKWQTADPIGYPDGWNNLAYCNNGVTSSVDLFGTLIASIYSIT